MDQELAKLIQEKTPPFNTRYAEKLRVVHFTHAKHGHGLGTIVAYNGVPKQMYIEEKFSAATEMAAQAGLLDAVVNSMYDGVRCPYVVQWDNGYKDVYEHSSLTPYDPNNPDHDPGPQVKIRAQCGGYEESMETAALVRATIEDIRNYFRRRGTCNDNSVITISEHVVADRRNDWLESRVVMSNGNAIGFIDGNIA